MAAMTPTGTPTSQTFCAGSSRRMPTVRWSRMASQTRWAAKRFLISLSWGVPNPVSSQAMRPSSPALDRKAWLTAWTMASSFSWEKVRRTFCASSACFPNSLASCREAKS